MTKFLADYLLSNEGKNIFPVTELYKLKQSAGNRFSFQSFIKSKQKHTPSTIKHPYVEIVERLKIEQKEIVERGVAYDMLQMDSDIFRDLFKRRSRKVSYKKFKKIFGNKKYNYKKFKISNKIENIFKFNLTILVKKNNVFCTLSNFDEKKTIKSCSSGKYRIKVSKKTLRYTYDLVLDKFYRDIRKHVYPRTKKKKYVNWKKRFIRYSCLF